MYLAHDGIQDMPDDIDGDVRMDDYADGVLVWKKRTNEGGHYNLGLKDL